MVQDSPLSAGLRSLGQEGPLEGEMATHSSILAWEIPWTEEPGGYSPWGHKESDMTEHSTEAVCLYPTMEDCLPI